MGSQWFTDDVTDPRMIGGGLGDQSRDIVFPVFAGSQEVGMNDDEASTLLYTTIKGHGNCRFGDFHVGWFDNFIRGISLKHLYHAQQRLVACLQPGTVINNDDCQLVWRQVWITHDYLQRMAEFGVALDAKGPMGVYYRG